MNEVKVRVSRFLAEEAIGNHQYGVHGFLYRHRGGNAAMHCSLCDKLNHGLAQDGFKSFVGLADGWIARGFGANFHPQYCLVGRLIGHAILKQMKQRFVEITGITECGKMAKKLLAVAFGQALDQLLLGFKVDIERPGADPGLGANVVHCGAVKALLGKAKLCRIQNAVTPTLLLF